ncbi:hypothetical protein M419DRAFT_119856, partial [Trichoderma reesei RUT C-30]
LRAVTAHCHLCSTALVIACLVRDRVNAASTVPYLYILDGGGIAGAGCTWQLGDDVAQILSVTTNLP